jgi:hypothetical protein
MKIDFQMSDHVAIDNKNMLMLQPLLSHWNLAIKPSQGASDHSALSFPFTTPTILDNRSSHLFISCHPESPHPPLVVAVDVEAHLREVEVLSAVVVEVLASYQDLMLPLLASSVPTLVLVESLSTYLLILS